MEIVYDDDDARRLPRPGHGDQPRAPGAGRPLPRRRHRDRRRRPVRRRRAATSAGSWSTSRRPASTPATPPARCRRSPWGTREIERIRRSTEAIARGVGVRGLLNVQYALAGDVLYVLEANPRASRTVPFVSKATAVPLAKAAARVMHGRDRSPACAPRACCPPTGDGGTLPIGAPDRGQGGGAAVRPVPRRRHRARPGDAVHRRGHGHRRASSAPPSPSRSPAAYAGGLPTSGRAFVSVANRDKRSMIFPVKRLADLGFEILATEGTAEVLRRNGLKATVRPQAPRGPRPQRRADDGPGHPRRRRRPHRQHPVRGRPPARRLRDPHRRRGQRASRASPRCRGSRRRCRASRR